MAAITEPGTIEYLPGRLPEFHEEWHQTGAVFGFLGEDSALSEAKAILA